jgi:hypothetical protein
MSKPVSNVTNVFAKQGPTIPLVELDVDYAQVVSDINDLNTYANFVVDSGVANAYVLNYPTGITSELISTGTPLQFQAQNLNTGASTLVVQVNGVEIASSASIVNTDGSVLKASTIAPGGIYTVTYTGAVWQLSSATGSGGGTSGTFTATAGQTILSAPTPVGIKSDGYIYPIGSGWVNQGSGAATGTGYNKLSAGVQNATRNIVFCGIDSSNVLWGFQQDNINSLNFSTRLNLGTVLPGFLSTTSTSSYAYVIAYAKADGLYINNLRTVGNSLQGTEAKITSDVPLAGTQIRIRGQDIGNYWYGILCYVNASSQTIVQPVWLNLGQPSTGGAPLTLPTAANTNIDATTIGSQGSLCFLVSTNDGLYQLNYTTSSKTVAIKTTFDLTALFGLGYTIQKMTQLGISNTVTIFGLVDSIQNTYIQSAIWDTVSKLTAEQNRIAVISSQSYMNELKSNSQTNNFSAIVSSSSLAVIEGFQYANNIISAAATQTLNPSGINTVASVWSNTPNTTYNNDLIICYIDPGVSASPLTEALQLSGATLSTYVGWVNAPVNQGNTTTGYGVGTVINNLQGLVPGNTYYIDATGNLNTDSTNQLVGQAVSPTALILGQGESVAPSVPFLWQPVQLTNFTVLPNSGYPVNTTAGAIMAMLPATPAAGDLVTFTDYAQTFVVNALTINPNGNKIQSSSNNINVNTSGASVSFVYVDAIAGWLPYSGLDYGTYSVSLLIVAGGGGGGNGIPPQYGAGGGGGAGGVIAKNTTVKSGQKYLVAIGAGGGPNSNGNNTKFSEFAANGGGGGGQGSVSGSPGGSGGGAGGVQGGGKAGGEGTPTQGYNGGNSSGSPGGGGGGANGNGANAVIGGDGASGGPGVQSSISGSVKYYGGGGGGGGYTSAGSGGIGGGGSGSSNFAVSGSPGTPNTGGGGGGGPYNPNGGIVGGVGGSGITYISYPGPQLGLGGTVTSVNGFTIHTFTSTDYYTA